MAKLNLLAKVDCTFNPDDGISIRCIFVQVTDEGGDPVTGLAKKDFDVWRGMMVEQISTATPQGPDMPGIYAVTLKKPASSKKGQFVYTVRAQSGSGKQKAKGWTLADLVKL